MSTLSTVFDIVKPAGTDNNDVVLYLNGAIDLIDSLLKAACPAGTIRATSKATADTGWLLFNQTIVGGQTTYPDLWASIPVGWQSGANIVLPAVTDKMLMAAGATALGAAGGANSHIITAGELAAHSHTVNSHSHGGVTGSQSADHTHGFTTGSESANHTHTPSSGGSFAKSGGLVQVTQNGAVFINTFTHGGTDTATSIENVAHTHSGNTGGVAANHTHTVGAEAPGTTSVGSGTSIDTRNAHLAVTLQIRAF